VNNADLGAQFAQPVIGLAQHGAPIYVQLATLFRRFIVTGQWPVERQVPTHEEIAAQFDVNPATVRKAMAMLEGEGLVKRFRRRGTFVTARPAGGEGFRIPTRWEELLAAFEGLKAETLESRTIKSVPSPFHEGGVQARGYRFSRRLYRRAGRPVALEASHLDSAIRSAGAVHPLRLLERSRSGRIARAEQTLRFGIADSEVAAALDIALNAPVAMSHVSVFGRARLLHFESLCFFRGDVAVVSESIRFGAHG
jgi:GntR family transcriptional regulator